MNTTLNYSPNFDVKKRSVKQTTTSIEELSNIQIRITVFNNYIFIMPRLKESDSTIFLISRF